MLRLNSIHTGSLDFYVSINSIPHGEVKEYHQWQLASNPGNIDQIDPRINNGKVYLLDQIDLIGKRKAWQYWHWIKIMNEDALDLYGARSSTGTYFACMSKTGSPSMRVNFNNHVHITHCDAISRNKFGSTVAQVMAWCHLAPSHYLNQC